MFTWKRGVAWTVAVMLQAALCTGATRADEAEEQVLTIRKTSSEGIDVISAEQSQANPDKDGSKTDGKLKARIVKPQGVRGQLRITSPDGETFEIVGHEVHVGRPGLNGRAITILRTPGGEQKVLEPDNVHDLIGNLTDSIKDEIASEVPKFIIGVSVSEAPEALMVQLGRENDSAVVVDSVIEDSPAAKAGVKQFDLILKAAGEPVHSAPELTKAVKSSEGKPIELVLLRTGKELKVEITPRPNEPVRRTKVSDGTIHFGPAVMERRFMGEAMLGPGPLHEEIKALRKDMAELKKAVEELKTQK
jgi:hypothetical protein